MARRLPVRATLIPFLLGLGFEQTKETISEHTERYIQRSRLYDGDFPNAHQTIKTTTDTHFRLDRCTLEQRLQIVELMEGLGLLTHTYSVKGGLQATAGRNASHWAVMTHTRGAAARTVLIELQTVTSRPDTAFERSGLGHGQII